MLRRLAGLVVPLLALAFAASAQASTGYVSPFSTSYVVGRTDMGVDLCLQAGAPIRAVGSGVVMGIIPNWYEGQPYIWYELTSGPDAGRFVYVAEEINHLARAGQKVSAGQTIARFAPRGTCIETGWSAAGGETLAQATTGYKEGQVTVAGVSFARFLMSLGVTGSFELTPTGTSSSRHKATTSASSKSTTKKTSKSTTKSTKKPSSATKRPKPKPPTRWVPAPSGGVSWADWNVSGGTGW
jgi:hypothetical protein